MLYIRVYILGLRHRSGDGDAGEGDLAPHTQHIGHRQGNESN